MTVKELLEKKIYEEVSVGDGLSTEISKPYCCDLLSIAMGKAPAGSCWVTVMANVNTLAVASLTEVACVIVAEGMQLEESFVSKAVQQGITVLRSSQPVFDTAYAVQKLLEE